MANQYGFDFLRTEHILEDVETPADDEVLVLGDTSGPTPMDVEKKPDLEKQFDILAFLQAHRGSGCLGTNVIYKSTGIDLELDSNQAVVGMLQHNPKVKVELVPDPENPALMVATYAYQAKYASVRNRTTLLAQINRMTSGIPMKDLEDSYPTVETDLNALITAGDIIAIYNSEDRDKILFPRGESFLVELDGLISVHHQENGTKSKNGESENEGQPPVYVVDTDMDPRTQIRRGEAVQVGGQWFRLSSAVKEGPLSDQPSRAQAPLTVVSLSDLSKRNEVDGYIRPFSSKKLPLDAALHDHSIENVTAAKKARETLLKMVHGRSGGAAGQLFGSNAHASNPTTLAKSLATSSSTNMRKRPHSSMAGAASQSHQQQQQQQRFLKEEIAKVAADPSLALYSHARRHGCTKDVREMYLSTRKLVPEADQDFRKVLVQHKLLEPGEKMRRERLARSGANLDNDGKPKKRRYYERKNQRMTNTHLEGTELGAVLARAAEKQKQGKSVGDGGM